MQKTELEAKIMHRCKFCIFKKNVILKHHLKKSNHRILRKKWRR